MLSRVANSVYWMSRYIERAENVARFIDVNYNLTLGEGAQLADQWEPLVYTTGDEDLFHELYPSASREFVIRFLAFDRRNPNSSFHLSIGINYPNARDIEVARRLGVSPGGDIFIHGTPRRIGGRGDDWTWGCIAVTNREMEDIYAMVRDGTPITIHP